MTSDSFSLMANAAPDAVRTPAAPTQAAPDEPARTRRTRIVTLILSGFALCLAAAVIASRLAIERRTGRRRRRGGVVRIEPQVVVSAPTFTIALPFSRITEARRMPRGRRRRGRQGRGGRSHAARRRPTWRMGQQRMARRSHR